MGTYVKPPRMHVHADTKVKRAIEAVSTQGLRKIPDSAFLAMAGGAFVTALVLRLAGRRDAAMFVSEWAPAILLLGIYNKITSLDKNRKHAATT
jgi:hypothetical protein